MKIQTSLPKRLGSLVLTLGLALTLGACGLKEQKKQEKIEESKEMAERSAQWGRDIQRRYDAEEIEKARLDLQNRIAFLTAIAGDYEGIYKDAPSLAGEGRPDPRAVLRLRISVEHLPPPFDEKRTLSVADVKADTDALSLKVEILEKGIPDTGMSSFCKQSGVKPDYKNGAIFVGCQSAGGTREFTIELAAPGIAPADAANASVSGAAGVVSESAPLLASRLAKGELSDVPAVTVTIQSPLGKAFFGELRKLPVNRAINQ